MDTNDGLVAVGSRPTIRTLAIVARADTVTIANSSTRFHAAAVVPRPLESIVASTLVWSQAISIFTIVLAVRYAGGIIRANETLQTLTDIWFDAGAVVARRAKRFAKTLLVSQIPFVASANVRRSAAAVRSALGLANRFAIISDIVLRWPVTWITGANVRLGAGTVRSAGCLTDGFADAGIVVRRRTITKIALANVRLDALPVDAVLTADRLAG